MPYIGPYLIEALGIRPGVEQTAEDRFQAGLEMASRIIMRDSSAMAPAAFNALLSYFIAELDVLTTQRVSEVAADQPIDLDVQEP